MNSPDRPRLRAVEESDAGPAAPATGAGSIRGWLPWALGAVALALALGLLWQAGETARLRERLAASEAALRASEARVEALESYVDGVRDRFASLQETLRSELEALGALLASEPGGAPAGEAPAGGADAGAAGP